jgi:hypothetical protein
MPALNITTEPTETDNQTPVTRGTADDIRRQLGLTTRYAFEGPAEVVGMLGPDFLSGLYNVATDSQVPTVGSAVSQLLDRAGLPRPETTLEKVVGAGSKVGSGAGGGGVALKGLQALGRGATRLLSVDDAKQTPNFLNFLSEKPIAQGVGGFGGEAAVQGAMGLGVQNPAALLGLGVLGGSVTPPSAETVRRAGGALREGVGQLKDPKIGLPVGIGKFNPNISVPVPSILRGIGVAPSRRSSAEKAVGDFFMSRSTNPARTIGALKNPIETFTMDPPLKVPNEPTGSAQQTTGALAVSEADDIGLGSISSMVKSMFDDDALNAFERNRIYDQQLQRALDGWLPSGDRTASSRQVKLNLENMFEESGKPLFKDMRMNYRALDEAGLDDEEVFFRLSNLVDNLAQRTGNRFDPETQSSLNKVRKIIGQDRMEDFMDGADLNYDELYKDISDPENLYSIRKTIQKMIEGKMKKDDGMSRYKASQLRPIINEIDNIFMDAENVIAELYKREGVDRSRAINPKTLEFYKPTDPEYGSQWKNYLEEYSKNKTLEAQYDVIQGLMKKGTNVTVGADDFNQIGLPFLNAFRDKIDEHKAILSEGQFEVLKGIVDDINIAKQVDLPFAKTGGSDTFKNISIASVLSRFAGGNMPPEVKNTGSHKLLDALFIDNEDQVKQVLIQAWLDPTFASKLMQDATDRNIAAIGQSLLQNAQGGFVGGAKTTEQCT